ncbi:ABC transporter permease [Streptomyces naphthomycinicus]|uniref:ABC transporter permease n=1 Tax=Streptomyces naphthomycinicus TaxID=2872625 RepID=UPI0027E4A31B|nr:ABC-2 family transporter protein [Streptomyces sp. TML10]
MTWLSELLEPGRMVSTAIQVGSQVFLTACLWTALYAHTEVSAGLQEHQAVGYAVLAVLASRLRPLSRDMAPDSFYRHMREGTILYWFLRPLPPHRYHLVRALGDQAHGLLWVLAGYGLCTTAGVVPLPDGRWTLPAFLVSMFLGQVIVYQLSLILDLLCFWTVANSNALHVSHFVQSLLSGAFAPLWFFPGWFTTANSFLPFQSTLHIPLSIYVGRIPVNRVPREVAVQAVWCLLLWLITRTLWKRAESRVAVQGG